MKKAGILAGILTVGVGLRITFNTNYADNAKMNRLRWLKEIYSRSSYYDSEEDKMTISQIEKDLVVLRCWYRSPFWDKLKGPPTVSEKC
jgi:hypothetical protein